MAVRFRARGALLFATLATASSSGRPAVSAAAFARCDADPAARTLGVSRRDWHVACLRLDDGRRVIAAVPLVPLAGNAAIKPGSAPPLVIRLGLAKGEEMVWHSETRLVAAAPADLREVLDKSEEWLVDVDAQTLGAATGVRVGVMGHWGGDVMSVREIALIFRLPPDTGELKLLWSGLGNTRESRSEYCLIEGIATFHLVDDRTIERQMRVKAIVNRDTPVPRQRARALEKGCVVKPQPAQRFAVSS
jgi:hypothetical protein